MGEPGEGGDGEDGAVAGADLADGLVEDGLDLPHRLAALDVLLVAGEEERDARESLAIQHRVWTQAPSPCEEDREGRQITEGLPGLPEAGLVGGVHDVDHSVALHVVLQSPWPHSPQSKSTESSGRPTLSQRACSSSCPPRSQKLSTIPS